MSSPERSPQQGTFFGKKYTAPQPGSPKEGRRPEGSPDAEKPRRMRSPEPKTSGGYGPLGDGRTATEPPFSDAEHHRMQEVCEVLYGPTGAHARGVRIHNGPLTLRGAYPPDAARLSWIHDDKKYDPYLVFSAEQPKVEKSTVNHKLWLPRELHEPKKKGKKNSGPKYTYTDKDMKKSQKKLAERPRWDTEHHIMVSQANPEVQKFVREYFDKPLRKESQGVPKVRELYTMNDRQMGWWDEPSPLGDPKHTYLDVLGPWNVGGPREQQKVSYWRTVLEKSQSAPALKTSISDSRSHLTLTERLADVSAPQATQFWRDWVDLSKKRLPTAPEENMKGKKKKYGKRGGWPSPEGGAGPQGDATVQAAATLPTMRPRSPDKKDREWNNRWHVCVSKDNPNLAMGHRQFFSSAQFLSGQEVGHPGAYLGLASQKWRDAAKHVTLSPSGVAGRGSIGRRCMLY